MAYRPVEEDPFIPRTYVKLKEVFAAIGESFQGVYESAEPKPGNNGYSDKISYTFRTDLGNLTIDISPKARLGRHLGKAALKQGDLVAIQLVEETDIPGKGFKDQKFKLLVEDAFTGTLPKNKPNVKRAVDASNAKRGGNASSGPQGEDPF